MIKTSESVPGILSLLYESYNGRSWSSLSEFGANFEVLNVGSNLSKTLNEVYLEIAELSGEEYGQLGSLEEVKEFAKSKGYIDKYTSEESLLEESLIQLASARIKHGRRAYKNLNVEGDEPLDKFIAKNLKKHRLDTLEGLVKAADKIDEKPKSLNNFEFGQSQIHTLRSASLELENDYHRRWNAYFDRFYNLLDVFSKKTPESESDGVAFLDALVKWREGAKFKTYGLYDAFTAKLTLKDLERISSSKDATVTLQAAK